MAKRRRLVAPDKSDLEKLDESFAAKPPLGQGTTPPIAQVAAETAALSGLAGVGDRVSMARDTADAEKWRDLEGAGLAVQMIALGDIDPEYLRRDRISDDSEAAEELLQSIQANGLRAPIEVVATDEGYGLIAGQRRLRAFQALSQRQPGFDAIPAFVRDHATSEAAYVSMIEENEVRSNLTHYERGRIAVLSAQQGVFASVEDAVNALFQTASKAKRSKIRSFATIHESLGDLLRYPTDLTEKLGLRVASALKAGQQSQIRNSLDTSDPASAVEEAKVLDTALASAPKPAQSNKGGRPTEVEHFTPRRLAGGGALVARLSNERLVIEIRGLEIDVKSAEDVLEAIQQYLD